jgi:signal transduction histidine kinase
MSYSTESILISVAFIALFSIAPLALAIFFVIINRKNKNGHIAEKEKLHKEIQNQLLKSKVEIQESTLRSISEEIHDNVGNTLSSVRIGLHNYINENKSEELRQVFLRVVEVIDELGNIVHLLSPDFIKKNGIIESIKIEVEKLRSLKLFQVNFQTNSDLVLFPDENEVIIFRIFQEAVHNVVKHSKTIEVDIKIQVFETYTLFSIVDKGVGFNIKKPGNEGIGLANMRNRAKLIGAKVDVFSHYGAGTTVVITVKNDVKKN